jgi:hypothetical protein
LHHNTYNFAFSKKKCDIYNLHVHCHAQILSYSYIKEEDEEEEEEGERNVPPF